MPASTALTRTALRCLRVLPCEARSAGRARRMVAVQLTEWGLSPDLSETAVLLVSELAGNAARHTGCTRIVVSVRWDGRMVRVGVRDSSHALPVVVDAAGSATAGRGMGLVALLSDAWGVDRTPGGKVVWFRLRVPA